jgi:hypothetical protein
MRINPIDIIGLFVFWVIIYLSQVNFLIILVGLSLLSILSSVIWIKIIKRGVINLDRDKYLDCSLHKLIFFGWWIGIDNILTYNQLPSKKILSSVEMKEELDKLKRNKKINSIIE